MSSVVIETPFDGKYEPSESEILEYGKWLGMNIPEDSAFLWIAREGLKAPLPPDWKACKSEKGDLYYFNFKTGQSIWDHPMDEHFKSLFVAEKANPSPRSLAAGATLNAIPSASPSTLSKDHHSKHRHEKNHEPSTKKKKQPGLSSSGTLLSKVHALKSLKLKSELPDELKIDFHSNGTSHTPPTKLKAPVALAALDGDSPKEKLSPSPEMSDAVQGASGSGSPVVMNVVSPSSLSNAMPSVSSVIPSCGGNDPVARIDEVTNNRGSQDDKDMKLEERKRHMQADMEQRVNQYASKLATEEKKVTEALERKHQERLAEEHCKAELNLAKALKSIEADMNAQKSAEIQRLHKLHNEQFEAEKEKMVQEEAARLKNLREHDLEKHKEARNQGLREAEKLIRDLRDTAAAYLQEFEAACTSFHDSLREAQHRFAHDKATYNDGLYREIDAQLTAAKEQNSVALSLEKEKLENELRDLRVRHQHAIQLAMTQHEETLQQLMRKCEAESEEAVKHQMICKQEMLSDVIATLRATQQQEIEKLKAELRKCAEADLRSVVGDATKAHRGTSVALRDLGDEGDNSLTSRDDLPDPGSKFPTPCARQDDDTRGRTTSPDAPSVSGQQLKSHDLCASDNGGAYSHIISPGGDLHRDIKTVLTEALREVFAESTFALPSPKTGSELSGALREAAAPALKAVESTPPAGPSFGAGASREEVDPSASLQDVCTASSSFPHSFRDQLRLVASERQRVIDGKRFVESQRKNLEERRQQLRATRHQWKEDVLTAKQEGVRSSSTRGQLLNNVRLALEAQTRGLEHDEEILCESEKWLLSKEQRLMYLEQQIADLERHRVRSGSLGVDCSVDTAALVTGYFKSPSYVPDTGRAARRLSLSHAPLSSPQTSSAASPVFSKALNRIERRLDEVTSMINMQQRRHSTPSPGAASARNHRRSSTGQPLVVPTQNRHRPPQSLKRLDAAIFGREPQHVDPWQST